MITVRDVRQARARELGTREERRDLIQGITRLVNGNLVPPNRPGMIYVQEYFNQNKVMIVANTPGIVEPEVPVWVGPDPRRNYTYSILGVSQGIGGGTSGLGQGSPAEFTFPLHRVRHEFPTESSTADDVVRLFQPADYRLKTVVSGTGLGILIYPTVYQYNSLPYSFAGATADLTAFLPASGWNLLIFVGLRRSTGTAVLVPGTAVETSVSGDAPLFAIPDGMIASAYVRLEGGQTSLSQTDDVIDARDPFRSGGAGGVAGDQVRVSSADAAVGYLEDKLVAGTGVTITKNNPGADETLTIAASGGMTISEEDGTPSGVPDTLKFPNGSLTDNGDGSFSYVPTLSAGGGSKYIPAQLWAESDLEIPATPSRVGEFVTFEFSDTQSEYISTQYFVPASATGSLVVTLYLSTYGSGTGGIRFGVQAYITRSGLPAVDTASSREAPGNISAVNTLTLHEVPYENLLDSDGFAVSSVAPGDILLLVVYRNPGHAQDTVGAGVHFLGAAVDFQTAYLPLAPTLVLDDQSATTADLSWTHTNPSAVNFTIERSVDGGAYATLITLGPSATSHQDTGLTGTSSYSYRIYASNSAGNSPYSNVVSVLPVPDGAPTGLTAEEF